ncbi:hypothetical protein V1264_011294 [Littorina saxatilis]|uniref:Uncharacterized protein n=1 Tax=Littorina saxatilis TaxID=31220 RepID=A0AAN9GKV8_9CAEN
MAFVACSSQAVTLDITVEPGNTACELFYFLDPGTGKRKPLNCVNININICNTINVAGRGQTDEQNNALPSSLYVHMIVAQIVLGAIVIVAGIIFAMAAGIKMINYIRRCQHGCPNGVPPAANNNVRQNAEHGNNPPIQETEPHAVSRFC